MYQTKNSVFNTEIKKMMITDSSISAYINEKFKESRWNNYYDFFDNYLLKYGIESFANSPIMENGKFFPYVNCSNGNNIFNEKKGITRLSPEPLKLDKCQKIHAHYVISKLKKLSILDFENHDFSKNYHD